MNRCERDHDGLPVWRVRGSSPLSSTHMRKPFPLLGSTMLTVAGIVPRDLRSGEQSPEGVHRRPVLTGRGVLGVQSAVDESGKRFGGELDVC